MGGDRTHLVARNLHRCGVPSRAMPMATATASFVASCATTALAPSLIGDESNSNSPCGHRQIQRRLSRFVRMTFVLANGCAGKGGEHP
jgi:hypothetical protein